MSTLRVKDIVGFLEKTAPSSLQESYDNSGLLTGNPEMRVRKALITLDCTEEVVEEAINEKCEMIIAHHTIIFGGLKRLTGRNYVERTVIKAIKNDIAIYAIHTNLDNILEGVNKKIADKLKLVNQSILQPKTQMLRKLYTFVPLQDFEKVRQAVFNAGAGYIGNYSETSFSVTGTGTFKGNEESNPKVGKKGVREEVQEVKFEVIFPDFKERDVVNALLKAHPYEEVAYDIFKLENKAGSFGSGLIGELEAEMDEKVFLKFVKKVFRTGCIRYTALTGKSVKKVALCGGSGSFLLKQAISAGADAYISADFKYHEFFDAEGKILIADIGHYESEQFTGELIFELVSEKFPTFALLLSKTITNPVNYL